MTANAIVTFSHLRWDFVYQRPQQLLSRLSQTRPVLFIEEPVHIPDCEPHWEIHNPLPSVTVYRLMSPIAAPGFDDAYVPTFQHMLPALVAEQQLGGYITWLYTPLALPLAQMLEPELVVYDCMDELSAFLHAPQRLREHEAALMEWADLVFTGGRSMYTVRQHRHPNIHCFPSSVDRAHFGKAKEGIAEPEDQAALPHPRLGFFGVIDERMDVELIGAMAKAHPEWQIVMVGPVVKIDPAMLPQAPNIHWLGQRRYDELPAYLAGWDVCLLPFAMNDSTRFISPTKTLEYMAAERPIVSTPITDVIEVYGDIVYSGDTHQAFIAACEQALSANEAERAARTEKMRAVLAQTSWDRTASAMEQLIEHELATVNQ